MRKGARESLIVNNFFTLASIIIITVTIILYSKYIAKDNYANENLKEKVTTLECEKIDFSAFKVYNQELLNESQKALNNGFYKLIASYEKSVHAKSIIEDFISLEETNQYFFDSIKKEPKEDVKNYLTIKYEIIENDKKNPNKKSKECLLCSGSIMTTFLANDKEIFKYYTDFKFYDKNEIKSKIDCTIKVYKNHVKKL